MNKFLWAKKEKHGLFVVNCVDFLKNIYHN